MAFDDLVFDLGSIAKNKDDVAVLYRRGYDRRPVLRFVRNSEPISVQQMQRELDGNFGRGKLLRQLGLIKGSGYLLVEMNFDRAASGQGARQLHYLEHLVPLNRWHLCRSWHVGRDRGEAEVIRKHLDLAHEGGARTLTEVCQRPDARILVGRAMEETPLGMAVTLADLLGSRG